MLSARYYNIIYYFVITVITFICCLQNYKYSDTTINQKNSNYIANFLVVFLIFFIGTRPISGYYFVDMKNYADTWKWWGKGLYSMSLKYDNFIFDNIMIFMSSLDLNVKLFFLLNSLIYFSCILFACRKLFPNNVLLALIAYLGAFSTFSYATNGIKAGSAAAIFLIAIANAKNWKIYILLLLMSYGFHHSMILPISAFILVRRYNNIWKYVIFWFLCLLLSIYHITWFQSLFSEMSAEIGDNIATQYLSVTNYEWGGQQGFRLDFVLYSSIPIFVGCYIVRKYKIESIEYIRLFDIYVFTNAIWMLCMYAPFTNRIAYLSWFMYPIVLFYPIINFESIKKRKTILFVTTMLHLLFTLFMTFIYYR